MPAVTPVPFPAAMSTRGRFTPLKPGNGQDARGGLVDFARESAANRPAPRCGSAGPVTHPPTRASTPIQPESEPAGIISACQRGRRRS
jgi:hypothetical protein